MEIKENMYVRTKITDNCNNVYIVKICEVDEDEPNKLWIDGFIYDSWGDDVSCLTPDDIDKASYNIIDLIEVGDYVNGEPVINIEKFKDDSTYLIFSEDRYIKHSSNIETIVTHEQFDNMKYEVE